MSEATTSGPKLHEMGDLTMLHYNLAEAEKELALEEKAHAEKKAAILARLQSFRTRVAQSRAGIDIGRIAIGARVVVVSGTCEDEQDRGVAQDAIRELALGPNAPKLGDLYRGCELGGGYITRTQRHRLGVRLGPRKPIGFTPEEIEAAIYYLTNIERIQAAAKAATEKTTT